jgi:hypothetical protein
MHTFIINTTLLTLCHSDMFQLQNDHLQGDDSHMTHVAAARRTTHCSLSLILHLVTHYVDFAAEMYPSHSLKLAH